MAIFWVKCAISLPLLSCMLITLTGAGPPHMSSFDLSSDQSDSLGKAYRGSSCPDAEAIKPCACSSDDQFHTSMRCSQVENEEQLRDVFSNDFPVTDMFSFQMICNNNKTLPMLKEGDFGNVTFKNILIAYCGLTDVEEAALAGSYDTLELLSLQENSLTSIPDLSKFKVLKYLYLVQNQMTSFPNITSGSLSDVNLSGNQFHVIPEDILAGMTALTDLSLYNLAINQIEPGIFTENENLNSLDLSNNVLTTIPANAIKLYGDYTYVFLSNNQINKLYPGSFSGVKSILDLRNNLLTELEENIFKELLEEKVDVMLEGNRFGCACDIAWLIINGTLLDRFYASPKCADGTPFVDLNPLYYEENC